MSDRDDWEENRSAFAGSDDELDEFTVGEPSAGSNRDQEGDTALDLASYRLDLLQEVDLRHRGIRRARPAYSAHVQHVAIVLRIVASAEPFDVATLKALAVAHPAFTETAQTLLVKHHFVITRMDTIIRFQQTTIAGPELLAAVTAVDIRIGSYEETYGTAYESAEEDYESLADEDLAAAVIATLGDSMADGRPAARGLDAEQIDVIRDLLFKASNLRRLSLVARAFVSASELLSRANKSNLSHLILRPEPRSLPPASPKLVVAYPRPVIPSGLWSAYASIVVLELIGVHMEQLPIFSMPLLTTLELVNCTAGDGTDPSARHDTLAQLQKVTVRRCDGHFLLALLLRHLGENLLELTIADATAQVDARLSRSTIATWQRLRRLEVTNCQQWLSLDVLPLSLQYIELTLNCCSDVDQWLAFASTFAQRPNLRSVGIYGLPIYLYNATDGQWHDIDQDPAAAGWTFDQVEKIHQLGEAAEISFKTAREGLRNEPPGDQDAPVPSPLTVLAYYGR